MRLIFRSMLRYRDEHEVPYLDGYFDGLGEGVLWGFAIIAALMAFTR